MALDSSIGIANKVVAITPADSDLSDIVQALYVGVTGDVRVTTVEDNDVTFQNVTGGSFLPIAVKRVWSTNTTASGILGLD